MTRSGTDRPAPTQRPSDTKDDPILRYQDGDARAFQDLVGEYSVRLSVFFYRHFWDRALAEDLSQEVFMKIFRGAASYEPQGRPDTYVWRVARNVLIDQLRSMRVRPKMSSIEAGAEGSSHPRERFPDASPHSGPLDTLSRLESMERLRGALGSLSIEQRLAFEMGVLEGLKYADIAEILECPVGTVKSRIFNAVRNLRRLLPDLDSGDPPETQRTRSSLRGSSRGWKGLLTPWKRRRLEPIGRNSKSGWSSG